MKFFKNILILLVVLFVQHVNAQLQENFSDGDFTSNPTWSGSTSKFLVNGNFELQSNGNSASGDTLWLSTPNTLFDSVEFSFKVMLGFNPSSTNYLRIYLASDSNDFRKALNGYYLLLGETGSNDTIKIFKQTGTLSTLVFAGSSEIIGSSATTANISFYITRNSAGVWKISADKTGGTNYISYGTFIENTITATSYFGVYARYSTASRFDKYYFDDFVIRNIVGDTSKPNAVAASIISSTQVDLLFSEQINIAEAQTISNYSISGGIGNATNAAVDIVNKNLVHLTFGNALVSGSNYTLSIANISDLAGNQMLPTQIYLSFFEPEKFDVLINEIMPDPDPKVGLPAVEYVELFNRSAFAINIGGWKFSDASSTIILPPVLIPADSFAVIVKSDSATFFTTNNAIVIPVASLPSLNNDKDSLTLKDVQGKVIHSLLYSDSWYGDDAKKQGGFSLELRNPNNPCAVVGNWIASNDENGGTPGKTNSVYEPNLALDFRTGNVTFASVNSIRVSFTQTADGISATNIFNYTVNNGIGNPQDVLFDTVSQNSATLIFAVNFDTTKIYKLTISNVRNCVSLGASTDSFTLAFPQKASRYDVLITEIMADPDPQIELPNREYLEIYNRSGKAISLKNWILGKPTSTTAAKLPDVLLMPNNYLLLCGTTAVGEFSNFAYPLGLTGFPSLNNTGDAVFLKDADGKLISYVEYSDSWYGDAVKKNGGWSLEMIDTENPCGTSENWTASTSSTGGTPGTKNAVAATTADSSLLNIVSASLVDSTTLRIVFDKNLDSASVVNPNFYTVNNGIGNPQNVSVVQYAFNRVLLSFSQAFHKGVIYSVKVNGLSDCQGNGMGISDTARFAIPDSMAAYDVVINEILFKPKTGGVDFIELYNRSAKVIDISKIRVIENDATAPENVLETSDTLVEPFLLFPDEYAVFTPNPDVIKAQYVVKNPLQLIKLGKFPNFADGAGICVLKTTAGLVVDSLSYSAKWHYALLDDKNGVSLERIDYNKPTNDKSNWHSAAGDIGFATPTYLNSQFYATGISEDAISIEPEVFSPDNDGYKDFTFVKYHFAEPGYQIYIRIFDGVGREVKYLVKAETLGASGEFQWDGTNNDGTKASIGIYTVFAEVFNLQGKTKRFKKEVVLGARLD